MQAWLAQHMPEAVLLALQEDGIQLPQASWGFAQQTSNAGLDVVVSVTGAQFGATDVTDAVPPA